MNVICDKTKPYIDILHPSYMFSFTCILAGHQSRYGSHWVRPPPIKGSKFSNLRNFNEFTIQAGAHQIQLYRSLDNVSYIRYWHSRSLTLQTSTVQTVCMATSQSHTQQMILIAQFIYFFYLVKPNCPIGGNQMNCSNEKQPTGLNINRLLIHASTDILANLL